MKLFSVVFNPTSFSFSWIKCLLGASLLFSMPWTTTWAQSSPPPPSSVSPASDPQEDFKPAILYGMGGKFDQSFGYSAYLGIERFKKQTGISYREFEPQNDSQTEQAIRRFVHEGYSPIIAIGFEYATIIEKLGPTTPKTKFIIIDTLIDQPNVQSILFKDHEGAFLVGALAAQTSHTNTIGFVGGMDTPLIRKFSCGYTQGARYIKKDIQVLQNMVGTTPSAWHDPVKGSELAKSQMDRGADIVFHAAGASGIGVLRAVADAKKLGIGVDSNQNGLFPGSVLTSMLKRIDVATYKALLQIQDGTWRPGVISLGVADNGVEWALDEHNRNLITSETQGTVKRIERDIRSGALKVHDYTDDKKCPTQNP